MKNIKRNRSQGQVIIGMLAIILLCGILMVSLFNKGLALREKTSLVNAADAIAYSDGIITARRLNFLAYTNRAMVVNNLAAGHAVNAISWHRYITNAWQTDPAFFNDFFPSIVPDLVMNIAMKLSMPSLTSAATADNQVNTAALFLESLTLANNQLAAAQQDTLANSLLVNADVRNVIAAQYNNTQNNTPIRVNDPTDLQTTINLANSIGDGVLANELSDLANGNEDTELLAFVETSNDMAELEQLTLLGLNGAMPGDNWFSARDWRTNPGSSNGRNKLFTSRYSNADTGTVWQADETAIQPLANGALTSDWQATDAVTFSDGTTVAFTGSASALDLYSDYEHFPGSHVRLPDNPVGLPLNTTLSRTVFLSKDLRAQDVESESSDAHEGLRSFNTVQYENTQPNNDSAFVLTAYARAQVFYQRPAAMLNDTFSFAAIPNATTEYANLYSPFWQARLIPVPSAF